MFPPATFYSINYCDVDNVTEEEKELIKDFSGGWRLGEHAPYYDLTNTKTGISVVWHVNHLVDEENYFVVLKNGVERMRVPKRAQPKAGWDSITVFRWLMSWVNTASALGVIVVISTIPTP